MKRQKPSFKKDWWDEFTPFEKWFARKYERLKWKEKIRKEVKDEGKI